MKKILFICHGNICRSPMAEFIMKDLVRKQGLQDQIYIESAATTNDDLGADMYYKAREILDQHGIPYSRRRARRLSRKDYQSFDHLFVMDEENLEDMHWIFPEDPENKIEKLNEEDVEDPWYTRNFAKVYREIEKGCTLRLQQIQHELEREVS